MSDNNVYTDLESWKRKKYGNLYSTIYSLNKIPLIANRARPTSSVWRAIVYSRPEPPSILSSEYESPSYMIRSLFESSNLCDRLKCIEVDTRTKLEEVTKGLQDPLPDVISLEYRRRDPSFLEKMKFSLKNDNREWHLKSIIVVKKYLYICASYHEGAWKYQSLEQDEGEVTYNSLAAMADRLNKDEYTLLLAFYSKPYLDSDVVPMKPLDFYQGEAVPPPKIKPLVRLPPKPRKTDKEEDYPRRDRTKDEINSESDSSSEMCEDEYIIETDEEFDIDELEEVNEIDQFGRRWTNIHEYSRRYYDHSQKLVLDELPAGIPLDPEKKSQEEEEEDEDEDEDEEEKDPSSSPFDMFHRLDAFGWICMNCNYRNTHGFYMNCYSCGEKRFPEPSEEIKKQYWEHGFEYIIDDSDTDSDDSNVERNEEGKKIIRTSFKKPTDEERAEYEKNKHLLQNNDMRYPMHSLYAHIDNFGGFGMHSINPMSSFGGGMPGMPGMSGMSGGMPGMPGMSGGMPGMPGMSGGMPGMPGMSGGMPGMPGMSGGMPQGEKAGNPNISDKELKPDDNPLPDRLENPSNKKEDMRPPSNSTKPKVEPPPDWECSYCTQINDGTDYKCDNCEAVDDEQYELLKS